ncbi:MAG: vWA domain-containing protein [Myxococcota bacterium]
MSKSRSSSSLCLGRLSGLVGLTGLALLGCDAAPAQEAKLDAASATRSDATAAPAPATPGHAAAKDARAGSAPAVAAEAPAAAAEAKPAPPAERSAERRALDGLDGLDEGDEAEAEDEAAGEAEYAKRERQPLAPRAGQLTAGRWSDRDDWSRWQQLLAPGSRYHAMLDSWALGRLDRVAVTLNGHGRVPADAAVVLEDAHGHALWSARTDNRGRADLYLAPGRSGRVVVHGPHGETLASREVQAGERHELRVREDVAVASALDLMFVVDTTGSMGDELSFLQSELTDIVQRVQRDSAQELQIRTSVNFYRDRGDDYVVRHHPFTTDLSQTLEHLRAEHAAGGGDYPEALDHALANAIGEHRWSDSAVARVMFVLTDAPAHPGSDVGQRLAHTTALAASKGIRIVPVASSGVDKPTEFLLRHLAVSTGGTYVFLTDHSGIGGSHIEPTVGPHTIEPLNDLMVEIIDEYTAATDLQLVAAPALASAPPVVMHTEGHSQHDAPYGYALHHHRAHDDESPDWWMMGLGLLFPALVAGFWWQRSRRTPAPIADARVARARRMVDELTRRTRRGATEDTRSWSGQMQEVVRGMEQLARQQQAIDTSLRVAGAEPTEADPTGMRASLRAEVARRRATIDAEIDAGLLSVETAYLHVIGGVGERSATQASLDAAREALQTRIEIERELRT